MKSTTSLKYAFVTAITIYIALPLSGLADVGGGSGRPDSPYRNPQLSVDGETVDRLRDEDAASRVVNFTTPDGTFVFGQRVGTTYARAGATLGKVENGFVGLVDAEQMPRKIEFSTIRRIVVADKDNNTLTLQIELFPDITTEELLKARPSYTELKERYMRTRTIRVPLWSNARQPLALVGKDPEENAPRKIIALFKDIPKGQKIDIGTGNLWWAIGSVTDDPAYPYRLILKY